MSVVVAGCSLEKLGNLPALADRSSQYLLLRLLLGNAEVAKGRHRWKQKIDYSSLPATTQTKTSASAIKDFLTTYGVGGSTDRFIRATIGDNREFYREILCEFLHYFLQTSQGCNTAAFVFLYRVLERISYSIPLLYASTQREYMGTFRDLRSILNADVEGELGLFRKFLAQGRFIDPIKLQVDQKIRFSSSGGHQSAYYAFTTRHFTTFTSLDPALHEVEVKFRDVSHLLVTIRNRFFHSRTGDGRDNITTIEMADPDEYFSCINPVLVSFLAIVVLQTIAKKYAT